MINFAPLADQNFFDKHTNIRIGKVTAVDPSTSTYTIQGEGATFLEGKPAASMSGGMFRGSGDASLLQEGARVLYVPNGATGYILGCLPEPGLPAIHTSPNAYSNINSDKESQADSNYISYRGGNPPDMLPGDFVKYTPEGGFISLLRGSIAKIGAGPLSQISFNSIDDLCRLSARNFEVFTDFGETRVVNDEGESSVEVFGSPVFHESLGADNIGEELGTHSPDGERNRYRTEPYDRMGKWRIHAFAGWLGDALHLFISRRGDTNKRTDKSPQDGVTEVVLANDGSVRVRSCRELMLEKVSRIHVPKKIREAHQNEKGDTKEDDYAPTPHEPFDWDEGDKEGRRSQIAEYHSHVVDHEEIRHFKDHKKDWNIESERSADIPKQAQDLWEGSEEDPFEETYSLIHQRSDGSVYIEDTHGSCIDMSKENVSISAKKDIRLQAGRDILMTAGRDFCGRSDKEFELVSHGGNFRAKAHLDMRLAGEQNASLDAAAGNVTMLSRKGHAQIRSERQDVMIKSDLGKIDIVAITEGIDLRATKDLQLLSDGGDVKVHGSENIQLASPGNILLVVGPEAPSASMSAKERDCFGKTSVTEDTDSGNVAGVTAPTAYLELSPAMLNMYAQAEAELHSDRTIQVFTPNSHLLLGLDKYELSSTGDGILRKNGNLVIQQTDSDGDTIWRPGSTHSSQTTVDPSPQTLESVLANEKENELADGRFRYRTEINDDIRVYEYPWQKMDLDNPPDDTMPWKDLIDTDNQDTPDLDLSRPVQGNDQVCNTGPGEQLPPFSQYKKYTRGEFSFLGEVTTGSFSFTDEYYTPTSWDDDPVNTGRVNNIPDSAKGESFQGTLDEADTEDVINKLV